MTDRRILGASHPLTLAEYRSQMAQGGLAAALARLGERAEAPGHGAVIAADFAATDHLTGPLSGIPIGVKDNIDVAGFATTGGSPALRDNRPPGDAAAVARLRAAGAILPCKLNMHELAFGVTSWNSAFGAVTNPADPLRTAGGSSGGSAAAVARGIVPVALGTDTGGSVRIPASFCGVAGFRPSQGRYPADGMLGLSPTRDTIGIIAASVADIAEVDAVLAGDPSPPASLPDRPLRLGLAEDALPGHSVPVETAFRRALDRLAACRLIEVVALPPLTYDRLEPEMGLPLVFGEALPMWEAFCRDTLGCTLADFAARLGDPHVRQTFADMPRLAQDSRPRLEAIVAQERAALIASVAAVFAGFRLDLMVAPTATVQPPLWTEAETLLIGGQPHPTFFTVVRNTSLATLTGAPSLTLPAGRDEDGLPVGMMLEALPGADGELLGWAAALEDHLR